jgi:putative membrane protein
MWDDMGFHGWGWFGLGLVHMLLFWALVILVIAALVKWLSGSGGGGASDAGMALRILEERYARGEISRDEYLRMKSDLAR